MALGRGAEEVAQVQDGLEGGAAGGAAAGALQVPQDAVHELSGEQVGEGDRRRGARSRKSVCMWEYVGISYITVYHK